MGNSTMKDVKQLRQLFERTVDKYPQQIALECGSSVFSYLELEQKANQLAHYLLDCGVEASNCVGVLLERSIDSYVAFLAVLKIGATYIPIEIEHPDERINHIFQDISIKALLTSSQQCTRTGIQMPNPIILDQVAKNIACKSTVRPDFNECAADHVCYIIYTSGSSGRPKGVEITHRSICHYVTTASLLYEVTSQDKIYQGFSLAFDASLEEIWMAFANAATLVIGTSKDVRSGIGLVDYLIEREVTIFSTVPTLLLSLEVKPITSLRLLILGGEACAHTLIKRWSRDGLRIVNTYGPTEATVIATCAECHPDKPITIGNPLNGYHIYILDDQLQPVVDGQAGELCIGGIGLARGYVNRPDITREKFIQNPLNAQDRLYRTGDLAAFNEDGQVLFLGRVDEQVKIRGFRVELNEIEAVLMEDACVHEAVVALQNLDDEPILVAYLVIDKYNSFDLLRFKQSLRQKLPYHMIPTVFEQLAALPLLSSGKVDRKNLPKISVINNETQYHPPQTALERKIDQVFATVFQKERISIGADFFYDLGGHSLSAAQVISKLRLLDEFKQISILDLYNNPTIQQLAEFFKQNARKPQQENTKQKKYVASNFKYWLCGVGQFFGCLLQYALQVWQLLLIVIAYQWISRVESQSSLLAVGMAILLTLSLPIATCLIVIAAKWLLLGRVKPGEYKLWGGFYFRWWLVNRLLNFISPASQFAGTPVINLYYRLLGAKIGKNCFIGTTSFAIFDNLTIGNNTSVGYDVNILDYVVEDGWLKIGPINIGNHCFIGARSVIGIHTTIQDSAVLDNMTMLSTYNCVPRGQFYSGSPARKVKQSKEHITSTMQGIIDKTSGTKTFAYGVLHYLGSTLTSLIHFAAYIPGFIVIDQVFEKTNSWSSLLITIPLSALISMTLYFSCLIVLKKILANKTKAGIYPIKSMEYLKKWLFLKLFDVDEVQVLADSLYFPILLRLLGAKLGKNVEMGETPHMLADLVTLENQAFTASSTALAWPNFYQGVFQVAPIKIKSGAFSGNVSLLPLGHELGEEALLGCLTVAPDNHQAARKKSAWLGSPAMYLPQREVCENFSAAQTITPSTKTYVIRLGLELIRVILPTTLNITGVFTLFVSLQYLLVNTSMLFIASTLPFVELGIILTLVSLVITMKWSVQGKLQPIIKPLWDIFIRKIDLIEYTWSYFVTPIFTSVILGTPFISVLLRCFGAKIGKKVFIDTDLFAEFDLISIGDNVCLNEQAMMDTHLYEDRVFKVSTINIQQGCNVGISSIVLYDTVMEEGSTLSNLSLLMKGEQLPANTTWQGIPSQPIKFDANLAVNREVKHVISDEIYHDGLVEKLPF